MFVQCELETVFMINLMDVDDSGRWNIVDNTYNGNTWSRITNTERSLYIYISVLICEMWQNIPIVSVIIMHLSPDLFILITITN